MRSIEDYFLNKVKSEEIHADNTYISDGIILVKKELLHSELLKKYVTQPDRNIMNYIPFERGEDYELPNHVFLYPHGGLDFRVDSKNIVNYNYIKIFMESFEDVNFTVVPILKSANYGADYVRAIKVWRGDRFAGCIACALSDNPPRSAEYCFDTYIEDLYEFGADENGDEV